MFVQWINFVRIIWNLRFSKNEKMNFLPAVSHNCKAIIRPSTTIDFTWKSTPIVAEKVDRNRFRQNRWIKQVFPTPKKIWKILQFINWIEKFTGISNKNHFENTFGLSWVADGRRRRSGRFLISPGRFLIGSDWLHSFLLQWIYGIGIGFVSQCGVQFVK